jgi:hypothetical protein
MDYNKKLGIAMLIVLLLGIGFGLALGLYSSTQKKYKMNLKCVQGELYEEIRPNMYVKSHLECFEQRSY